MQTWKHIEEVMSAPVRHFYARDRFGDPRAVIARIEFAGLVHVGISVCAQKSSFTKERGREIAIERARRALAIAIHGAAAPSRKGLRALIRTMTPEAYRKAAITMRRAMATYPRAESVRRVDISPSIVEDMIAAGEFGAAPGPRTVPGPGTPA